MTVTLRKPTSPEYRNFSEEVKKRAGNDSFAYGEDEVINVFIINWLPFKNHPLMLVYSLELVYKIFDLNGTELSEIKESMEFIKPQVLSLCSNSTEKWIPYYLEYKFLSILNFSLSEYFKMHVTCTCILLSMLLVFDGLHLC